MADPLTVIPTENIDRTGGVAPTDPTGVTPGTDVFYLAIANGAFMLLNTSGFNELENQ